MVSTVHGVRVRKSGGKYSYMGSDRVWKSGDKAIESKSGKSGGEYMGSESGKVVASTWGQSQEK